MEKDTLPPDKLPQSAASTDADCQPGHASASQITNNHSPSSSIIPGMFCATCTSSWLKWFFALTAIFYSSLQKLYRDLTALLAFSVSHYLCQQVIRTIVVFNFHSCTYSPWANNTSTSTVVGGTAVYTFLQLVVCQYRNCTSCSLNWPRFLRKRQLIWYKHLQFPSRKANELPVKI